MDETGINRAIIVPPMWMGDTNVLALEAARAFPDRLAVLGRLDINKPVATSVFENWNKQSGMLGLRFTFSTEKEYSLLTDGSLEWLWYEAEKFQIPVMLMVSGHLQEVEKIINNYPDIKLCIDHLGLVRNAVDDAAFEDLSYLLSLSTNRNLVVKVTSLPCYSSKPYPYYELHPYIRQIFDSFGPSRMFWGSDLTRLTSSYRECLTLITEELRWLSENDKKLILGVAICNWLGWEAKEINIL
jgi:predicted TIM-barrel fold metal-dependent hydrolase